jgi:hypothetical protein
MIRKTKYGEYLEDVTPQIDFDTEMVNRLPEQEIKEIALMLYAWALNGDTQSINIIFDELDQSGVSVKDEMKRVWSTLYKEKMALINKTNKEKEK